MQTISFNPYYFPYCGFSLYIFFTLGYYKLPAFPKKQVIFFRHVVLAFLVYFFSIEFKNFIFPIFFVQKSFFYWILSIFISSLISFCMLLKYCFFIKRSVRERVFYFDRPCSRKKILNIFFQSIIICILFYPFERLTTVVISWLLNIFFGKDFIAEQTIIILLKSQNLDISSKALLFVTIAIITPFIEEFLFRGMLQGFLREKFGRILSIIITSFLFSLIHFSHLQGMGNILILGRLFVSSLCLGWFYEFNQSLTSPIFLHMLVNIINTCLIFTLK